MGLSVVIPSKNAANLVPCIRAIRVAGETCRIIVVDDGALNDPHFRWTTEYEDVDPTAPKCGSVIMYSDEELPDVGKIKHDGLKNVAGPVGEYIYWVRGAKPFVFAKAINMGIRAAGEDSVICLNDDALLKTPGGFSAMWKAAQEHPEFGIISPAMNNVGNTWQWQHPFDPANPLRFEPRTLCFVCVLIPRRTIDLVGLMDERYVGYGMDDDDACLTVRRAGLKLGIFDGAFVDHHSLTSSFRAPSPTNSSPGDFRPNMRLFIEKWGVDNWGKGRDESKFHDLFPHNRGPELWK